MRRTRALALIVSSMAVIGTPAIATAATTPPTTTPPTTTAPTTTAPTTTAATTAAPATTAPAATSAPAATTAPAAPTVPAPTDATATSAAVATTIATEAAPAPTLGAGATVEQMQAAAQAVIGPTDDAFGRFANIAPFSLAIPTPPGSFLTDFNIQYFDDDYIGSFELQLAVPAAEAVATFQAAATAAGLELEEDTTASNANVTERELRFDDPGNTSSLYFTVTVRDTPNADTARIQFQDEITLEVSDFTRTWATAVSMPTGGEFSYGVFRFDGDYGEGSVGVSYDFPAGDAAAMKAAVIATMPANGFTYDAAEDAEPESLALTGDPAATAYTNAEMRFRQIEAEASVTATAYFTAETAPIPDPPAPDPAATTAAPATTTTPSGPTTPVSTAAPIFAPGVTAGMTTAQIRDLAGGIFGPTTDAPAELSPFIPVLAGIPTPPDAVVEAFDIRTLTLSGGLVATGQVLFTTATPPADLLALYGNAAATLGMAETANATTTEDGEVTTAVAYEVAGAEQTTGFDLHVVDGETDYVQLTITTPTTEAVGAEINAAVMASVGLPAGGEVEPDISVGLGWFSDDLNFRTGVDYSGDEATVRSSVDAAIVAAGGTLDAESSSDNYQYYATADGGEVQISYYDNGQGTTTVTALYSLPLA